jgi:hypothetical protein
MKVYLIKCIKDYLMEEPVEVAFKKGNQYTFISVEDDNRLFTFDEAGVDHFMNMEEIINSKCFEIITEKSYEDIKNTNWMLLNG